ncbi:MAG: enoyl-CoA hydratase/isomerase family protein [Cytophagaceae bacterium]|nr:enoyl-CoA hydratase/isomerase family protein [Cytophagaceae bacterium]
MSVFKNLAVDLVDGILMIIVNRVEKLNALNFKTLDEIKEAIQKAYDEPEVKAVIITGAGEKAFVAGADIGEFTQINDVNARKFSENGQDIFNMIESCPKPVIAAINGFALGGGCELALACHMRIASDNAKIGLPEVTLGILPGYGGTQRLTHLIGKGRAIEMMMTGEMITAQDAYRMGLVNHVTDKEVLIPKCKEILNKIMSRAPLAIAQIVECVNAIYKKEEDGYQTEANSFSIVAKTDDFKEGIAAFLEKRKAEFKGR